MSLIATAAWEHNFRKQAFTQACAFTSPFYPESIIDVLSVGFNGKRVIQAGRDACTLYLRHASMMDGII